MYIECLMALFYFVYACLHDISCVTRDGDGAEDVVVEVPTIINHSCITPDPVGKVPKKLLLEQLLPRWIAMEHTLETFHSGDRSMLLWNVLQHHQIRSYEDAEVLLDDFLSMSESVEAATHYKIASASERAR